MSSHILEWLNLAVRWFHVIVGVAWIGASFYFVWLENNIEKMKEELRDEIAGDLWAIHGGGIYYLEKYKLSPEKIPKNLHWFKWEAYATWISGFSLLVVVYYFNAQAIMIDSEIADITTGDAIAISLIALFVGQAFYDLVCRSPILKHPRVMLFVMFAFMTASAWGLFQFMQPRAAYIHVGAMLGTMMAGNVFFVIIPNQKRLVAAAEKGEKPDPWQAEYAGMRSRHNNYFTLPVLFIMISNHYPTTYGGEYGWLVLAGLSAAGVAVRHHFNVRHKSNAWAWTIPAGILTIAGLAWFTAPKEKDTNELASVGQVEFKEVRAIIATRCATCHSKNPSDDVFTVAPNGVKFDRARDIVSWAPEIKKRAYDMETMPQANKTKITKEERIKLGAWVVQGAKTD